MDGVQQKPALSKHLTLNKMQDVTQSIACIHLNALRANLATIQSRAPQLKTLAMIKANAYGHGLVSVAKALTNADALGVATLSSAIALRQAGITQRIVLMTGFLNAQELSVLLDFEIDAVIHQPHQLALLAALSGHKTLNVWLKINTGMNRLGFEPSAVYDAYQQLVHCPAVKDQPILMSHFSRADNTDQVAQAYTQQQYTQAQQLRAACDHAPLSMSHSAGLLTGYADKAASTDWIRPGVMLYGISPMPDRTGIDEGLQPVMTLTSRLIARRTLQKGDQIGYAGTWTAPEAMPMGVVAIGYGDGYSRQIPSGTPVLIHGVRCPLIGRVSMDMITVDLRPCVHAQIGDQVTLWGNDLPIETIAQHAQTIPYTLLTGITNRVQRQYD